MTGYGKYTSETKEGTINVEIRSLNHRYLNFSPSIPQSLFFLEENIKEIIQSYFDRGSIELYITLGSGMNSNKTIHVDFDLIDQYVEKFTQIKDRYLAFDNIPIDLIMQQPEMFSVKEMDDEYGDNLVNHILSSVEQTCMAAKTSREKEGSYIAKDIKKRMRIVKETIILIKNHHQVALDQYRERVHKRVSGYLKEFSEVDESRVYQEVVLIAEKGDITEEITRLLSHIEHFDSVMDQRHVIGRKLDFIIQEMNREVNTIGSKSIDIKISKWAILLKNELDKIREQAQNIE